MTMALTEPDEVTDNGTSEGGEHTATVSLRITFAFINEFDYARKLLEVLGGARAAGEVELLNVDREAGNVRSERRGRDRLGTRRSRSPSAIARSEGDRGVHLAGEADEP